MEDRINTILRRYELLIKRSRTLTNKLNDIWEERESLRNEYKTLTGNDISKRHEAK